MQMAADCEGMASLLHPASPNLCAEHCQQGDQSDQPRTPAAPAMSLISLYDVAFAVDSERAKPPRNRVERLTRCASAAAYHPALLLPHLIIQTTLR